MATEISKKRKSPIVRAAVFAIMTALVCVATILIQIPIPQTKGYINIGDTMIFVTALTFGTVAGGFSGGVGSALADVLSGYAYYAPITLIVKGVEGLLAGLIANRKNVARDVIAVAIGGSEMILGYFLAEFYILSVRWGALAEVPGNIFQIVAGGIVGIPVALVLRKRLPEILK
jgi:uncharacterized membrane protein